MLKKAQWVRNTLQPGQQQENIHTYIFLQESGGQHQPLSMCQPWLNSIKIQRLDGRTGCFSPVFGMRPIPKDLLPEFEFLEILNLNNRRELRRQTL